MTYLSYTKCSSTDLLNKNVPIDNGHCTLQATMARSALCWIFLRNHFIHISTFCKAFY